MAVLLSKPEELHKKFIDLIDAVDNIPFSYDYRLLYKLYLPDHPHPIGFIRDIIATSMPWSPEFSIDHSTREVHLNLDTAPTASICTATFSLITQKVIDDEIFSNLFKDRPLIHSEPYRVLGKKYADGYVEIERFAAPLFGIVERGAHMTAFVRPSTATKGDEIMIWVAKRSQKIATHPGMLDTTAAGGVKSSHEPRECIIEEAHEEASLDKDFVKRNVKDIGHISYLQRHGRTQSMTTVLLWCYEIELGEDVVPAPLDDEVEAFHLMSVTEVVDAMIGGQFKPNCCLVMLQFFIEHGVLEEATGGRKGELAKRLVREFPIEIGDTISGASRC